MTYEIRFKAGVEQDLLKLDNRIRILVAKQLIKLSNSPELGDLLGNMAGYDLTGYRKLYVDNKKVRIVYKIIDSQIVVEIIAIGDRDDMAVYKKAADRI